MHFPRRDSGRAWVAALGSLAVAGGLIWDISWHVTIGRDSAFSPPHLALYAGAAGLGALSAWLVLRATRVPSLGRDESIRIHRLFGPAGAWVTLWGMAAVLIAVPFDAWWHAAYGLDVTLISVPHTILLTAFVTLVLGGFLIVLAAQNRVGRPEERGFASALAVIGGCLIVVLAITTTTYASRPNNMHSPTFHLLAAIAFPFLLAGASRSMPGRWSATSIAAVYSAILLVAGVILPLVPASPRVGPVLNEVTRMVPPALPLLLVVPAAAFDAVLSRAGRHERRQREWPLAIGLGLLFVALFGAAQWLLAEILLGPTLRDWVSAAERWPYYLTIGEWRTQWWGMPLDVTARVDLRRFAFEIGAIVVSGIVSCRAGLFFGGWASRLVR